jgi:hypothetical protein
MNKLTDSEKLMYDVRGANSKRIFKIINISNSGDNEMIKITVENITEQEFIDLLSTNDFPHLGDEIILPNGIGITNASSKSNKFMDNEVFHFFVQTLATISINIFSAYLYDKFSFCRKEAKLKINDKAVKIDEAAITKALTETISNDIDIIHDDNNAESKTGEGVVNVE